MKELVPEKLISERVLSLDAFRGFIILAMISRPSLPSAERHPSLAWILTQFDHAEWEGATFWDLIQPAFMLMVGMVNR